VPALSYNADGSASLSGPNLPGRWLYQIKDLPLYDNKGNVISYTVEESINQAYASSYTLVLPEAVDRRDSADGQKVTITPQPASEVTGNDFVDLNRPRVEYYGTTNSNREWYYIVRFQNVKQ
jgi:hypothetical protein